MILCEMQFDTFSKGSTKSPRYSRYFDSRVLAASRQCHDTNNQLLEKRKKELLVARIEGAPSVCCETFPMTPCPRADTEALTSGWSGGGRNHRIKGADMYGTMCNEQ